MRNLILVLTALCFFITSIWGTCPLYAQEFRLPAPGVLVHISPDFNPPILKGIKVHPDDPFRFDFILDQGDLGKAREGDLKQGATRLIKYFLASLTIPDKDLWVNLSPYEKDRIIPQSFGLTEMGRDLLAEDYMRKQITASLIYPEDKIGEKFWKRIYEEASKKFGTTNIPVKTFNKVWIVPEKAVVYENAKAGTAYIVESKLKVMLEEDYLSMQKHADVAEIRGKGLNINRLGSQIVREIVIPELTKEINENKNFAQLRQVYNSLILAAWYKKKIKDSILEQVYADKKKIAGVGYNNSINIESIYDRYLQAFKKGVYNYIKEDQDPITQQIIPRKYFSGGMELSNKAMRAALIIQDKPDQAILNSSIGNNDQIVNVQLDQSMGIGQLTRSFVHHFTRPVRAVNNILEKKRVEKRREERYRQVSSLRTHVNEERVFQQFLYVPWPNKQDEPITGRDMSETLNFIDAIFVKAKALSRNPGTRIVFLKAGAEALYRMAKIRAMVTGEFPVDHIHSIWLTMGQYKEMEGNPQQAVDEVKYMAQEGILTDVNNILFVDTDTELEKATQAAKGTYQVILRTLLDQSVMQKASLGSQKWNAEGSDRHLEFHYMNVLGTNDLGVPYTNYQIRWGFIDNIVKILNVNPHFIHEKDGRVSLEYAKPYDQPFDSEPQKLGVAHYIAHSFWERLMIDYLDNKGYDVSSVWDQYLGWLSKKLEATKTWGNDYWKQGSAIDDFGFVAQAKPINQAMITENKMEEIFINQESPEAIFDELEKEIRVKATAQGISFSWGLLNQAYHLILEYHTQPRIDSRIYSVHPLEIALYIVKVLGIVDEDIILAALLHDMPEDTSFTMDMVRNEFGPDVADIVGDLTESTIYRSNRNLEYVTKQGTYTGRRATKLEHLDRVDRNGRWRSIIIKGVDRLNNLYGSFLPAKQIYAMWPEELDRWEVFIKNEIIPPVLRDELVLQLNKERERIGNSPTEEGRVAAIQEWNRRHNSAMKAHGTGGIDLTSANMNLQTQNAGEAIKFQMDAAMLARLQNVLGFVPVIINIHPMTDLKEFLGIN